MATLSPVTTIDLQNPATLFAMQRCIVPKSRFLSTTYFSFNPTEDLFNSNKVLIQYEDKAGNTLAPFVRSGFKSGKLEAFNTYEFTPARMASNYDIKAADIEKLSFGEAVFSDRSPQQRAFDYGVRITQKQNDAVRASLEKMAADLMLNNETVIKYVKSDANGPDEDVTEQTISFNDPNNDGICKADFDEKWDDDKTDILEQLEAMAEQVVQNGAEVSDILLGNNAYHLFRNNPNVCKLFDNRRYNFGFIEPEKLVGGASVVGHVVLNGRTLRLIQYSATWRDEQEKKNVPFLDPDSVILTSPKCGRAVFASVTQLEQYDGNWHTHKGVMVPNFLTDFKENKTSLTMTSRPVLAPTILGCWVSAKVVAGE